LLAAPGVRRVGQIASVDIGVVTGADKFFILDAAEARRRRLPSSSLTPILRTMSNAPGLRLRPDETRRLLILPAEPAPRSKAVLKYLEDGKELKIHERYKARTRKPWYRVPLPRTRPDAFLPYMNHHAPRLVVNSERAWSTNLIHGVKLKAGAPSVRALSAAMLSSMTMLSAEIEGRAYGGGVLKFETKEAERLAIPPMTGSQERELIKLFPALDKLVRSGKLEEASERVDALLGVDRTKYVSAYGVFRKRRLGRKLAG
jgi:adenine-specific DNA-methyltransferase